MHVPTRRRHTARALPALATAAVLALTAGCAGGGGDGGDQQAADEQQTISFYHWRAEDKETFDALIRDFRAKNPTITVEQSVFPSEQYQATAQTKIRDGSVGDVFTAFRGAQFESIAKAGLFADLTGEGFVDNYQESLIEPGRREGKQLGLPYQLVFNDPLYSKAAFAKAGVQVPTSWPAFLDACRKLKSAGYIPVAFPGGDPNNAGQLLNTMVMNNLPADDGFAQLEQGKAKATDAWWVKTLSQYREAQDAGCFAANALGTKTDAALALFAQGKAAILPTGSFQVAAVRKQAPDLEIDLFAPITTDTPEQAKYEGVYNTTFILGVNARSAKQAAAKKFVEFLSDPANAATYADGTAQLVTVEGVKYDSPDLAFTEPWLTKKTLLAPRFQFNNLEIRTAIENSVIAVLGGTDPARAAAEAQKIVDEKR